MSETTPFPASSAGQGAGDVCWSVGAPVSCPGLCAGMFGECCLSPGRSAGGRFGASVLPHHCRGCVCVCVCGFVATVVWGLLCFAVWCSEP